MTAGKLRDRVTFGARTAVDDGYGNEVSGPFEDRFTVWGGVTYLRGSEAVIAARLEGRQPAVVRVRTSTQTRQITTDWRVRNERTGSVSNVRSIIETEDRAFLDIAVEAGVAA